MWRERQFEELPCLIVEDSRDDLGLLEQALTQAQVPNPRLHASTANEAMRILSESREATGKPFPAVLFLDLLMPSISGLEVLAWLRDHPHPPLAIVLHTGIEDDELLQAARDLGASYYLPKGARIDAVQEVFRRARAEWRQNQLLPE